MIFDVGRVCVKIAGRDAGRKCVIVENHGNFVTIDGNVRKKKVNIKHLEPLTKMLDVSGGAKKAFEKEGWAVWKHKARKAAERPKRLKKKSVKPVKKAPKLEVPKSVEEAVAKVEDKAPEVKESEKPAEEPKTEEKPAEAKELEKPADAPKEESKVEEKPEFPKAEDSFTKETKEPESEPSENQKIY
tara:strand:- start:38610 stop:39170 length:561 start_codon:yes stop_codon:yes gene_type:complete